uniref:Uncharacterized protein n=1 Tax=Arundo donax TaxID=35708 RepID=A0A0A9FJH3_ARUDO
MEQPLNTRHSIVISRYMHHLKKFYKSAR